MNYDDIQIVVVDFKGVNRHLRLWLGTLPNVQYASDICIHTFRGLDLLAVWRNQIAEWFLKETDKKWLVTFDDDVIPHEDTIKLLDAEEDVAVCRFFAKHGQVGHGNEGSGSMAALKVSRKALEKIERPWFRFHFNDNHTEQTMCECEHFCSQARKADFHPVKAGVVFHAMKVGLLPPETPEESCKMLFLHQIPTVHDKEFRAEQIPAMNDYGSHLSALTHAVEITRGPILELGCGNFSTPILRSLCPGRKILSLEWDKAWYEKWKANGNPNHVARLMSDYDYPAEEFSVVFVDHGAEKEVPADQHNLRMAAVEFYRDKADIIVVHDTEHSGFKSERWKDIKASFSSRVVFKHSRPWTTLLSNKKDLKGSLLAGLEVDKE